MKECPENWRECGHCMVAFAPETHPVCNKAGFWAHVLGDDMCPNAPMPDQLEVKKKAHGMRRQPERKNARKRGPCGR